MRRDVTARAVMLLLVQLLGGGCLGGEVEREEGAFCRGSVECAEELECYYDRCRALCSVDADCSAPSACIATLTEVGFDHALRVCTIPVEESCLEGLDCPTTLYCGPDNTCHEGCDTEDQCGGERICVAGVCLEPGRE